MLTSRKGALFTLIVISMVAMGVLLGQPASAGPVSLGPTAMPSPGDAKKYEYKGIFVGATTDAVRVKLGDPKEKSDAMDMYVFSANEAVQFYYAADHKVNAMMITFSGDLTTAPSAKDVFGADVPPKPDGSVFKMERYTKEGYWMSYNRTAGPDAVVSIAVQRI